MADNEQPQVVSLGKFQWVVGGLLAALVAVVSWAAHDISADISDVGDELKAFRADVGNDLKLIKAEMLAEISNLGADVKEIRSDLGQVREQSAATTARLDIILRRSQATP